MTLFWNQHQILYLVYLRNGNVRANSNGYLILSPECEAIVGERPGNVQKNMRNGLETERLRWGERGRNRNRNVKSTVANDRIFEKNTQKNLEPVY